jgi:hypothetical protein
MLNYSFWKVRKVLNQDFAQIIQVITISFFFGRLMKKKDIAGIEILVGNLCSMLNSKEIE